MVILLVSLLDGMVITVDVLTIAQIFLALKVMFQLPILMVMILLNLMGTFGIRLYHERKCNITFYIISFLLLFFYLVYFLSFLFLCCFFNLVHLSFSFYVVFLILFIIPFPFMFSFFSPCSPFTIPFPFPSLFSFSHYRCGKEYDLSVWAQLLNNTGKEYLVEACHWGDNNPNSTWCPFSYYRSSGDIRANYGSIVGNLQSVIPLAQQNLSYPSCWAFPDALEIGVYNGPGGPTGDSGLSYIEARSQMGAWCVTSSPLILGIDMTNNTAMDQVWDIITNTEAIAINKAYYGYSGNLFNESGIKVQLPIPGNAGVARSPKHRTPDMVEVAQIQMFSKPLNATSSAGMFFTFKYILVVFFFSLLFYFLSLSLSFFSFFFFSSSCYESWYNNTICNCTICYNSKFPIYSRCTNLCT
jgi:Alpha galactosidase A